MGAVALAALVPPDWRGSSNPASSRSPSDSVCLCLYVSVCGRDRASRPAEPRSPSNHATTAWLPPTKNNPLNNYCELIVLHSAEPSTPTTTTTTRLELGDVQLMLPPLAAAAAAAAAAPAKQTLEYHLALVLQTCNGVTTASQWRHKHNTTRRRSTVRHRDRRAAQLSGR